MSNIDRIRPIAEPIITARGFLLYDIEAHGPVIRVTVSALAENENPSIDELSSISRELSRVLDDVDPIGASYTLEVSTPGLERKLRTPSHFEAAVGETASIKLRHAIDGQRRVRGTIEGASATTVWLKPDEADTSLEILFEDVDSARTIFEWGSSPAPAASSREQVAPNRRSTP